MMDLNVPSPMVVTLSIFRSDMIVGFLVRDFTLCLRAIADPSSIKTPLIPMENVAVDSRPSSLNILKKHYIKVIRLDEYIKETVSAARYAKVLGGAREHEGMRKLVETAYVCMNPKLYMVEDDDEFNDPSILSLSGHVTQAEVEDSESWPDDRL